MSTHHIRDYAINYQAYLLMQVMGNSITSLDTMMGLFGMVIPRNHTKSSTPTIQPHSMAVEVGLGSTLSRAPFFILLGQSHWHSSPNYGSHRRISNDPNHHSHLAVHIGHMEAMQHTLPPEWGSTQLIQLPTSSYNALWAQPPTTLETQTALYKQPLATSLNNQHHSYRPSTIVVSSTSIGNWKQLKKSHPANSWHLHFLPPQNSARSWSLPP